ncbi:MAG: MBL fold metallo-hydrolase [Pseudomonadota bacterium]
MKSFCLPIAALALALISPSVNAQSAVQPGSPDYIPSTCLAVAQNIHKQDVPVRFASFSGEVPLVKTNGKYDVTISFQGHSTYLLESPGGVKIATDFAGWLTDPVTPDVVTMNQAHSSHYTRNPDPAIKHVLPGWRDDGQPAAYRLQVEDVVIRNITTDLVRFRPMPDGNSVFIFEMGGLCIGHLGHLHKRLSDAQYTEIGRLDVVMVAIDGGLTLSHISVREVLDRLRSSVVLPMHVRSFDAMPRFLSYLGDDFAIERPKERKLTLSLRTLPKRPTVIILPGVASYAPSYD